MPKTGPSASGQTEENAANELYGGSRAASGSAKLTVGFAAMSQDPDRHKAMTESYIELNRDGFSRLTGADAGCLDDAQQAYERIVESLELDNKSQLHKSLGCGPGMEENLFYIDGKPAHEFAKEQGFQPDGWQEDERERKLLRGVIAAAVLSGRHHVDVVRLKTGKETEDASVKIGVTEVQADLTALDSQVGLFRRKPSRTAKAFYSDTAGDAKRQKDIGDAFGLKVSQAAMSALTRTKNEARTRVGLAVMEEAGERGGRRRQPQREAPSKNRANVM